MSDIRDRLEGALYGLFIGDALAAPTHWYQPRCAPPVANLITLIRYYTTSLLDEDYGKVTDYVAPKDKHPESMVHDHCCSRSLIYVTSSCRE